MPRSLLDTIHDAAARVRYGRTQDEMFRALAAGQVPGAPPLNSADTSEAERYHGGHNGHQHGRDHSRPPSTPGPRLSASTAARGTRITRPTL